MDKQNKPTPDPGLFGTTGRHFMTKALGFMLAERANHPSRELSIAITELQAALMWLNTDLVIKGSMKPEDTIIDLANPIEETPHDGQTSQ